MSRAARAILAIFLVGGFLGMAGLQASRTYLLVLVGRQIGLEVEAGGIGLTLTRSGPAVQLRNVVLREKNSGAEEHAGIVSVLYSPGTKSSLKIFVNGLDTSYREDEKGAFYNPVWDTLIRTVGAPSETGSTSAIRNFDVRFRKSRIRVPLISGLTLTAEVARIHGGSGNGGVTVIEASYGDSPVNCMVPTDPTRLVDCFSPKIPASAAREFLSHSRLLPARVQREIRASGAGGEITDLRLYLWVNGDFELQAKLKSVVWEPSYFPVPALDGVSGGLSVQQKGNLVSLDMTGQWNSSSVNLSLTSAGRHSRGQVRIEAQASDLKRAFAGFPLISRLDGHAPMRVEFSDNARSLKWSLDSRLEGMAIRVPQPLHKELPEEARLHIDAKVARLKMAGAKLEYDLSERLLVFKAGRADLAEWNQAVREDAKRSAGGGNRQLPEVNLIIDSVAYKGKSFGRLELKTARQLDGFSVERLRIESAQQKFVITGARWTNELPRTQVKGWFETSNVSQTLELLGLPKKVEGSPFRIGFDLSWPGHPWEFSTENLDGTINGEIAKGQLNATNSVIRRILSLAAIDFSNAINGRLDFDRGRAQMAIENGHARTNSKLNMTLARFQFTGETDLNDMTIDGGLNVTPMLSRSLLNSALLAFVPAAGLTVFALEADEDSVFNRLKTTRFRVRDSLISPKVRFDGW